MTDRPPLTPPEGLAQVPPRRFWGSAQPPKNRADMFSARTVRAAAGDSPRADSDSASTVATLRMYGPIDSWGGWWGISAKDVAEALDGLGEDVTEIRVRINSPGGEAWEGMAISNMLRAHPAKVVAVVDGLAASAASFIATSADETVMSPGTQLMIHDASGFAYGPAATMRKAATWLDSISNSIASLYAEAAGGTDEDWRALMVEETWYTAREAVDAGLADRVDVVPDVGHTETAGDDAPEPAEDGVDDRFDLSIFNYAGRAQAPAPKTPAASASGQTENSQEESMSFTNDLRQRLGIADENADEATILAALDEALTERTEPPTNTTATLPEGTVAIDAAQLAELQAAAREGRDARAQQQREHRERVVDAAVRDGRIAPARREAWLNQLEADPGAEQVLTNLATGLVPVDEQGHDTGGSDPAGFDDAEYQAFAKQLGISPKGV